MNITGSLSNDRNCRFLAIIFRVSNLVRPDLDELSDIRPVQLINTNVKRGTLESCYTFFLSPRNPAHFPLHFGFHHLVPVTAFPALIVIRLAKIASLLPTLQSLPYPFRYCSYIPTAAIYVYNFPIEYDARVIHRTGIVYILRFCHLSLRYLAL